MNSMAANGQELSKYVTLVSSDGFEFVVLREAACVSGAIKRMLDPKSMCAVSTISRYYYRVLLRLIRRVPGSFAESVDGRCTFEEIKYVLLQFRWCSGLEREQSVMTKHDLIQQTLSQRKGLSVDILTLDLRPAPIKFPHMSSLLGFGLTLGIRSGIVLEKVAEYFYYNWRNRDATDVPDMDIPPELCLELLMAADYLDSEFHSPMKLGGEFLTAFSA
jgi:hypothetical protein